MARDFLSRVEREHGIESLPSARAIDLVLEALSAALQSTRAGTRELAERALRIRERLLAPDDLELAQSRVSLADVLFQLGELDAARTQLESALETQKRKLGAENLVVAATANFLGTILKGQGDLARARVIKETALAVRERLLAPDDSLLADSYNDLATIVALQDDFDGARALYERSLRVRERAQGPMHPDLALTLANLGWLQYRIGDYAEARESLERAIGIEEKVLGPEDRRVAWALNAMGLVLDAMGDFDAAMPRLERALRIREKVLGPNHSRVAETLYSLADVHVNLRQDSLALPLLERAVQIRATSFGPRNALVGATLMDLADVLDRMGMGARADSASAEAVSILEEAYGPKHHVTALALRVRANVRLLAGDVAQSITLLERARAIETLALGETYPGIALTEGLLAQAYRRSGAMQLAFRSALHSEEIARDHLRRTGRLLSEREALRYAATRTTGLGLALTIAEGGLPDSLQRMLADVVIRSRAVVLDEIAGRHRALAARSDTLGARLTADLAVAARRLASVRLRGPDDEHPEEFRSQLARAQSDQESVERALAERSASFRFERNGSGCGLAEVASALPDRSALLSFVRYQRVPLIGKGAAPDSPSDPGREYAYAAFVLADHGRSLTFLPAISADALEARIARWSGEAGRRGTHRSGSQAKSESDCRAAGRLVRLAAWDPAVRALRGASQVFVVADGAVNLISFAALPDSGQGYLVESGPLVHYLSAERDLATRHEGHGYGGLLAIGGPDFDARDLFSVLRRKRGRRPAQPAAHDEIAEVGRVGGDAYRGKHSPCLDFRSARFGPLPASIGEVQDILTLWRRVESRGRTGHWKSDTAATMLTGSRASESRLKKLAPSAVVIHLATHGFFLEGSCGMPADQARGIGGLVLEPTQDKSMAPARVSASGGRPRYPARENPLLLSGLVLAGVNHRDAATGTEEDGVLTAEEIATLDLSGVRLVVLSACDTGTGKLMAGEGVLGLRRAFQIAGAGALVMSLWSVEDRATARWMRGYYEGMLDQELSPSEAARRASRQVLQEQRRLHRTTHPFYWAGFVVAGDWR